VWVTEFVSLAMSRVNEPYQLTQYRNIIRCILTIESIAIEDINDDLILLRVNASILNSETSFTFNYLEEEGYVS